MKEVVLWVAHCCFAAIWCILAVMSIITITVMLCVVAIATYVCGEIQARKSGRSDADE